MVGCCHGYRKWQCDSPEEAGEEEGKRKGSIADLSEVEVVAGFDCKYMAKTTFRRPCKGNVLSVQFAYMVLEGSRVRGGLVILHKLHKRHN